MKNVAPYESSVKRFQTGLSLIELMIALAVGVFLLGGVVTVQQSVRQSFGSQAQLAQFQDSERLAMTILTDVIQSAGYFPDPTTNTAASALPIAGQFNRTGQAVRGTANANPPGDSITVRFLTASNDGILNCMGGGNTTANPLMFVNVFSIDNQGNLTCSLNGANAVPLVQGVQNMQIFYGVKTTTTNTGSVDSYLKPIEMTSTNWNNVISVKITLTFTNPLAGLPGQPATIPLTRVISVMGITGFKA